MCIIKLYKKIDEKMKRAPVKTLNFYNNLISGIIGGTIIYYAFITNFKIDIRSIIYVIFLYLIGLLIMLKNLSEIKSSKSRKGQILNYHLNLLAAILGAIYIMIIFTYTNVWVRIIDTIGLIIIFTTISYFRIKKR